jgi:hypothetical protein
VAVSDDGRLAAFTAPRGSIMLVFDVASGGEVEVLSSADICGVAAGPDGFACSTGAGLFLRHGGEPVRMEGLAFDNHLVRI